MINNKFYVKEVMYKIDGIDYSEREIEIISCMCNGCSSKLTANLLHISHHTVNSHVKKYHGENELFFQNCNYESYRGFR